MSSPYSTELELIAERDEARETAMRLEERWAQASKRAASIRRSEWYRRQSANLSHFEYPTAAEIVGLIDLLTQDAA